MEALRDSIHKLRFKNANAEGNHFVPEAELAELLSPQAVKDCLKNLGVAKHDTEELVGDIVRGARKCFSILLLIDRGTAIVGFFKHDSMQTSSPDDRLPFTAEPLRQAMGVDCSDISISLFLEKQWCFVSPILQRRSIFREFDKHIILPYSEEKSAGGGSMGDVYFVEIHPQCHRLPASNNRVVRKELRPRANEAMSAFKRELRNLSLLAHLNHPNIVELFCAYVYRDRCSLIFEAADGGTLAQLLDGGQSEGNLTMQQLLQGLAGLASAIDAVHNFFSHSLDIELTGCHHDLAPRNILIRGETLLLADFGLSTLRNPDEDSLTMFKNVRGSYVAPECQKHNEEGGVKTEKISRPSDVWSFGCILSEVLTYIIRGPAGVNDFREKRLITFVEGIEWHRFHAGPGKPHPVVKEWLASLETEWKSKSWAGRLISLIRSMLSMEPQERPLSSHVLGLLSGISVLASGTLVEQSWISLCSRHRNTHHLLEKFRFESWLFAFERLLDRILDEPMQSTQIDFALLFRLLGETMTILESQKEDNFSTIPRQHLLRDHNTALYQALPVEFRQIMKDCLLRKVSEISDANELGDISTAMSGIAEQNIGVFLAIKRLTILSEKGQLLENPKLLMREEQIKIASDLGMHSIARLVSEPSSVVVEWLKYRQPWADGFIGTQLRSRLASIAGLLSAESTSKIPGTLRCRGIFHSPVRTSFGLVYSHPFPDSKAWTLFDLLGTMRLAPSGKLDTSRFRPPLEYRFAAAHKLCQCIYTLHKIGWLHRNIHSRNVVFFQHRNVGDSKAASELHLLGLGASREHISDSFTQGHDEDGQLRNYQHPKYLGGDRYRPEFDYYSLGMILLEIGLWDSLERMAAKSKGLDDQKFSQRIIETRVTKLDLPMGSSYMEATRWCLECGSMGLKDDTAGRFNGEPYALFKTMVIDKIWPIPLIPKED